jgi:hypothetical protein
MADLPQHEAEPLIARTKYVPGNLNLQPRKNHAGYVSASTRADDDTGATIPGLTIEIELKAPLLVDVCKHIVSIYLLRGGIKWRVYQIEVQPPGKRSHNEPGNAVYGPHEHIGDKVAPYAGTPISCATTLDELFEIFCLKANISFTGKIIQP